MVEEQAASDIMDSLNLTSEQKKQLTVSLLHIISAVQLMEQQRTDLRWKMGSE